MKKLLLVLSIISLSYSAIQAQCTVISNATQTTTLSGGSTSGTEFSVAWNPVNQRYYSTNSGSSGPLMTYSSTGTWVSTVSPTPYKCGIWWNTNTNQLETNGYSSTGLYSLGTSSTTGNASGTASSIYTGYNQPSTYAQGAYDEDDNEVLYMSGSTIYRYNRVNGTQIGTITLSGYTFSALNSYFVGYTGCTGKELVVYDYSTRRAVFFNKSNGSYDSYSQLPAAAPYVSGYEVSYANNKIFLHNGSSWLGYDVIQTGISTSSISGPFCDSSTISITYTTDTITFNTGNVFTAQLSNGSGSFASPTNIGTVTSTTASTITATIPANTSFGTGYRIRVKSSSPSYSGSDNGSDIIINLPALELGASQAICSGSALSLQGPAGATSYSWSNGSGSQNISISTPGTYSLTISNSVCSDADTIVITGTTPITSSLSDTTSTCLGGSTTISAATTGVNSYTWSNGSSSSSISPTTSGIYVVTTTDTNGCAAVDSSFLSIVNPTISPGDTSICTGDTVELAAIGNDCFFQLNSLNTSAGTGSATISTSSSYYHGGVAVDNDYVYVPTEFNTTRYDKQTGTMTTLSDRDGLFSDLATGDLYTFWNTTYSDFYYTSSRTGGINAIRVLDQSLNLGTTINLSQTIVGSSGAIIFAGNGFVGFYSAFADELYKIDLSTGNVETLATNLLLYYSGTNSWASWGVAECNGNNEYSFLYRYSSYMYEYKTSTNSTSVNYSITNNSAFSGTWGSFTYSASDSKWYYQYYYYGEGSAANVYSGLGWGNASINGYSGSTSSIVNHTWNTGSTSLGISVSPTTATDYSVIVSDGISTCYDTVAIGVNALPTLTIADTISACNVDSVLISGPVSQTSYLWSNGTTTQNAYFDDSGEQWLQVTNSNGCTAADTVLVSIVDARLNLPDTTVCSADSLELFPNDAGCGFEITSFTTSNSQYRGLSSYGDDRSGMAVTPNYLYYVSDNYTIRLPADNLTSGTISTFTRRDGIFSDLGSGQLYTFWTTTANNFNYTSIQSIRLMDENLNYGATIPLSQTINPGYGSSIYAGDGFVMLRSSANFFYHIELSSGQVTELGTQSSMYTPYGAENWASWGVAECSANGYSIVYRSNNSSTSITRYELSTGTNSFPYVIGSLSDLACLTYSPWSNKWYGHSEGTNTLAPTSENVFSATASELGSNYSGFSNLSYTWSNGDTNAYLVVSPDTTTTYSLTVTDGVTSCYDTITFTVIQSPTVSSSVQDVLCNSDSTGSVGLTVSGGVSPYTYLWSNGSENDSVSTLNAGTYTVSVTGSNACVVPLEFTLTEPTAIITSISQTSSATCFEATDGGAYVTTSGGISPYTYLWGSGEASDTASMLNGDVNYVSVTDSNNCVHVDSIDITSPQAIPAAGPLTTTNGFICPGNSTTITAVNGSSGTGTSTYTATTNEISYTTTYQTLSFNSLSVADQALGNATLTVYYQGDRSNSSEYLQLYGEGSYYLGATTSMPYNYCNGYTSQSFTVTQSLMQTWVSDGSLQLSLYNYGGDYCSALTNYGQAYVEVSYPTSNERTFWFENACQTDTTLAIGNGPSISVSPASTRQYFAINYLDGCYSTCDSITITVAPSFGLNFTVATNPICAGSSTAIIVSGAANTNYQWSPSGSLSASSGNSVTASPTSTQPYSVQYTDFFGCTQYDTVTVDVFPEPILNILSVNNATCNSFSDGYAAVFGSNGASPYAYAWPNGTTNALAFNLSAGDYTVTVTDANSCQDTAVVSIGVNVDVIISHTATSPSCNGSADGSIIANAAGGSGPYTMNWSTGDTSSTITGLTAGTYTVTVTDNSGCYDSLIVTLNDPTLITVTIDTTTAQSCVESDNGSAIATGLGGTGTLSYAWSNGANTAINNGLAAGTYTITVSDTNACTATATTVISLVPSNLSAAITQVQGIDCFGANEAILAGTGTGGTGVLSYNWSNSSTNDTISNVGAGNYILTVNDAVGCLDTALYNVTNPAGMNITLTETAVSCNGGNDGAVTTSISGGVAPYSYAWNTSDTSAALTQLMAGNYILSITDANGCVQSDTAIVSEPTVLTVSQVAVTPTSCAGGNDAQIAVTIAGGTMPYTYAWSNNQSAASATGLMANTYSVTATDANGCSVDTTVIITPTANPINIGLSATDASCFGSATGQITATVTGNSGPYTYAWSNSQTGNTATNLIVGIYSVTVTNAAGCTNTAQDTISQPTQLTASITTTEDQSCVESNNGTATIAANSGTMPYTYAWPNGQTTAMATGLAAGAHVATVTDANGCATTATASIGFTSSNLTASIGLVNGVSCNGLSNASATGVTSGGTGSLSLTWSTGASADTIVGMSAGTYSLTVNDSVGCSASANITISEPTVLNVSLSNTPVICNGASNGTISSSRTGGVSPFSYNWNTGATTTGIAQASAGTYTVIVTDNNGCTAAANTTVSQPTAIVVSNIATTQTTCAGGSDGALSVSVAGGTSPLIYLWSNGSTSLSQTGLQAGAYTLSVTDGNGCIETSVITIQETDSIDLNLTVVNVTCFGSQDGIIVSSPQDGTAPYSFVWGNGSLTSSRVSLTGGFYPLTVTDANGCFTSQNIEITEASQPIVISNAVATDVDCFGDSTGTASLNVSGGITPYNYTWSNGMTSGNPTNLTAGNYQITIEDFNGCIGFDTVSISENSEIVISSLSGVDVTCFGGNDGSATIAAAGGVGTLNYSWSNGSSTNMAMSLESDTHTVSVTDALGCLVSDQLFIDQPDSFAVQSALTNIACNGSSTGSIALTVSGNTAPYSYTWSNGSTSATNNNIGAGSYDVTITDLNGCSTNDSYSLTQPDSITITLDSTNGILCNGDATGAIYTSVSGGVAPYTYAWNITSQTTEDVTGLDGGTHQLTVTDSNNCTKTLSVIIAEPAVLAITLDSTNNVSCNGAADGAGFTTVTGGTAPYAFAWSNTSQTTEDVSGLSPGTYDVTVTDINGCSDQTQVVITEPVVLTPSLVSSSDANCFNATDGEIVATGNGGTTPYAYNWSNGATAANNSNIGAGTYTVTITDNNGCSITDSYSISEPTLLGASMVSIDSVSCYNLSDGSVEVSANGGSVPYQYAWSAGSGNQINNGLIAGTYTVTISDDNGCDTILTSTVDQPDSISITISGTDLLCNNDSTGTASAMATGGTGTLVYTWSNNETGMNISPLSSGSYTVTVSDANGCANDASITLSEPTVLSASTDVLFEPLCNGDETGIIMATGDGGTLPYTIAWSNADTTFTINDLGAGNFSATITDSNGCSISTADTINQPDALSLVFDVTNAICSYDTNGSMEAAVDGGTSPFAYTWSTGDSINTIEELVIGTYTITITDTNGCVIIDSADVDYDSEALPLNLPSEAAVCKPFSITLDAGLEASSYLWSTGDTSSSIQVFNGGLYGLVVSNAEGCVSTDTTLVFEQNCVGIDEIADNMDVTIYPNPNRGVFTLNIENVNADRVSVKFTSLDGKIVRDEFIQLSSGAATEEFRFNAIGKGIYFMTIMSQTQSITKRVIIQ
jgi:hypothetical protein